MRDAEQAGSFRCFFGAERRCGNGRSSSATSPTSAEALKKLGAVPAKVASGLPAALCSARTRRHGAWQSQVGRAHPSARGPGRAPPKRRASGARERHTSGAQVALERRSSAPTLGEEDCSSGGVQKEDLCTARPFPKATGVAFDVLLWGAVSGLGGFPVFFGCAGSPPEGPKKSPNRSGIRQTRAYRAPRHVLGRPPGVRKALSGHEELVGILSWMLLSSPTASLLELVCWSMVDNGCVCGGVRRSLYLYVCTHA